MKRAAILGLSACLTVLLLVQFMRPAAGGPVENPFPAPDFTHMDANDWLNSRPLSLDALHGKVVLVDFWTFDCWNCYRSFPWLKAMEARLEPQGLQIVGAHSPEFDHEKVRANVQKKIREFGLMHPVMIDNDFSYWRAMGNRFWPAFYIIDKQGRVRGIYVGETHEGDAQAVEMERFIRKLLAEPV